MNKDFLSSCYYALGEKNITKKTNCSDHTEAKCCYVYFLLQIMLTGIFFTL
jgi:hypothetical protein